MLVGLIFVMDRTSSSQPRPVIQYKVISAGQQIIRMDENSGQTQILRGNRWEPVEEPLAIDKIPSR